MICQENLKMVPGRPGTIFMNLFYRSPVNIAAKLFILTEKV
ncbi:hypothetical protein KKC1_09900 [Calderihabitans maritimus]|uniref:Uncharacterized protein n=1 Tax=Calderihabitans maritimus TaxID=1246530 RepID=A0A1Z5HRD8_9FIRM|nr:hypothetical protein KKC1_09900 [Calderihabitans maritimus]